MRRWSDWGFSDEKFPDVKNDLDADAGAGLFDEDDEDEEKRLIEIGKGEQEWDAAVPETDCEKFMFRSDSEEFFLQERAGEWSEASFGPEFLNVPSANIEHPLPSRLREEYHKECERLRAQGTGTKEIASATYRMSADISIQHFVFVRCCVIDVLSSGRYPCSRVLTWETKTEELLAVEFFALTSDLN